MASEPSAASRGCFVSRRDVFQNSVLLFPHHGRVRPYQARPARRAPSPTSARRLSIQPSARRVKPERTTSARSEGGSIGLYESLEFAKADELFDRSAVYPLAGCTTHRFPPVTWCRPNRGGVRSFNVGHGNPIRNRRPSMKGPFPFGRRSIRRGNCDYSARPFTRYATSPSGVCRIRSGPPDRTKNSWTAHAQPRQS